MTRARKDLAPHPTPGGGPRPLCRHLLTVTGGTLGCTLAHGHAGPAHTDEDLLPPVSWTCSDKPRPGITVCDTFSGYLPPAESG